MLWPLSAFTTLKTSHRSTDKTHCRRNTFCDTQLPSADRGLFAPLISDLVRLIKQQDIGYVIGHEEEGNPAISFSGEIVDRALINFLIREPNHLSRSPTH